MMDEEIIKTLTKELRDGFGQLGARIDGTNARLDQTNVRLEQTNTKLEDMTLAIGDINTRLDQTIVRLDRTSMSVDLLRAEVNEKLDGVGSYLRSINGHILDHAKKIARLDKRLSDFETGKGN